LVKHTKDYIPYTYSSLHYFKRNTPLALLPTISGPDAICFGTTGTYTVSNAPAGFSWTKSSNLTSVSTSSNSATFTGYTEGSAWVAININGAEVARKNLTVGNGSAISITGPNTLDNKASVKHYPSMSCPPSSATYYWELRDPFGSVQTGNTLRYDQSAVVMSSSSQGSTYTYWLKLTVGSLSYSKAISTKSGGLTLIAFKEATLNPTFTH